jgi:hypothetical protein
MGIIFDVVHCLRCMKCGNDSSAACMAGTMQKLPQLVNDFVEEPYTNRICWKHYCVVYQSDRIHGSFQFAHEGTHIFYKLPSYSERY